MNNRLVEWATTPRGRISEMGLATWGKSVGEDPRMGKVSMDAVPSATEVVGCNCGCEGCGVDCGCSCCAGAQAGPGKPCPTCGKMLMSDAEGCDDCYAMDEADELDEKACGCKGPCSCDEAKSTCEECGAWMDEGACGECGRSEMLESVIAETKKHKKTKKHKGPSMKTQIKAAKTLVKKATGKGGKVSMTKLAKEVEGWAKDKYAAAQSKKTLAKK